MNLSPNSYFHVYNRSNNRELVFKEKENYSYFLRSYRRYMEPYFETIAYCLMPTHFHLLVRIATEDIRECKRALGRWLSSYTKALNKRFERQGSLFQQHTKASIIENERYLLTALMYVHLNPVRAGLVTTPEEWEFSSYRDHAGIRHGTLPKRELVQTYFPDINEFRCVSQEQIKRPKWL